MKLKVITNDLSVCKVSDINDIKLNSSFYFIGKTDQEISLVCDTKDVPSTTLAREDHWKGFRIEEGELDFSLIGILSKITGILAENKIGIFAISTFNTDYVLVKKENFNRALEVLEKSGYEILN
ncbi:hypothetical protein BCR32DRAFT_328727 [Anaeromyces robustus]|uniref:CASTOR ACT domain-containing protein n=1 Tax=Anaeromyces robustus TaxID=1754192 RepID=A0A1Y1WXK3_9FUNG|nr:hypothetical protein BCR32DRAFT_328727 [Anaeromyces robustus]|eukprot:ORX77936.1 hypothetical protein BCR32DRAFT_328727 [Anaeromyces robustus]